MESAQDRFEFGKNWTRYVQSSFSDERVQIAQTHMLDMLRVNDLKDQDFLDIGCGSGIHSLAAVRSSARSVKSFDYDSNSVAATNYVRTHAGEPGNWSVEQGDVLDDKYIEQLGKWSLVYSWGVLHHTGDVWRALENASRTVADGGQFYIALYSSDVQADPEYWLRIKQEYVKSGTFKRSRMVWWYVWEHMMQRSIFRAPNVLYRMLTYHIGAGRGMSLLSDIRDWLGGWPMQFVADKDVTEFLENRGFRQTHILTGKACTEFVFERAMKH